MKPKRKAPEPQTPAPGTRAQLVLFDDIEIRIRKRGRKERPAPDPARPLAFDLAIDRLIGDPDVVPEQVTRNDVIMFLRSCNLMGYGKLRARLQPGVVPEPLAVVARLLAESLGMLECEAYENPADFNLKLRSVRAVVLAALADVCRVNRSRVEDSTHGDPEADPVPGPAPHRSHARLSRQRKK